MKNKILIKLIVPEIDESFDIFVPTNEALWKIKKMIIKSINDLTNMALDSSKEYVLLDKTSGQIYQNNTTIYNTNIRNASELILLQEK